MITLKSAREIEIMARAGRIVAGTLALMREIVRPGMTTEEVDAFHADLVEPSGPVLMAVGVK